jgi:hypothetical protein
MRKNYSKQAAEIYSSQGDLRFKSDIFDLKISENKKYAKEGAWFKDYMNMIVPSNSEDIEEYDRLKGLYEVVNGDLSSFNEKISDFCNPAKMPDISEAANIEPYPKIYTKLNVLKGEFLKRGDNHKIVLLSAKAIKDKNEKMIEAIKASVEEELMLAIQAMQDADLSDEELQQYIEEFRKEKSPDDIKEKNFLADWEIFNSKCLQYCEYEQDITTKKMNSLEDLMISGGAFVYVGWKFGKPHIELRNRLFTGFHKNPNEYMIHKGDYIWYKDAITIKDAYNEYGNYLKENDLRELNSYSTNNTIDKRHDVIGGKAVPVFDHTNEILWRSNEESNKQVGNNMTPNSNNKYNSNALIWRVHFEFMAFRELMFLTYYDEYNEPVVTVMDSKAKSMIPKEAQRVIKLNQYGDNVINYIWVDKLSNTQYEAMILHVPRKYEVIRLGNSIYPIYREVPYQTTNINAPFSTFSLSTKGIIIDARNVRSVSMVERALPAYFEYLYVKKVQRDELSKYQGYIQSIDVDQIPDELGEDEEGNPIRDKIVTYLTYLKKTNKDLYSGSNATHSHGLPPATRSPGSNGYYTGTATELLNLQKLVTLLDSEIGLSMGISPQREAQFSPNSNVTDNQQAITQSHHITEPLFYMHNLLWKEVLQEWLSLFRRYCKLQLKQTTDSQYLIFQYITPDGSRELLEVTPDLLEMEDIGIWVANTTKDQLYKRHMEQMLQVIGQNPESAEVISTVSKAISSQSSPEEIHRIIQVLARQQQERMQENEKLNQQAKMQELEFERMFEEMRHEFNIDLLEKTEDLRLNRELEVTKTKYLLDADRDGVPDIVEKYKIDIEKMLKEMELKLKERDIKRQERQDERMARLKEKEISIKKQTKK